MDLAQMKAAVTMEGVLSGTAALELIAEVERLRDQIEHPAAVVLELRGEVARLTALCDGYRGDVAELKQRHDYDAARLRVLAKVAGCEEGVPDDATAVACAGTVLGMIRHNVEQIVAENHRLQAVEARVEHIKRSYAGGENWLRCLERAEKAESALTRARAEGLEDASRIMKVRAANAMRRYHDGLRGEVPASVIMALPLVTEEDTAAIRARATKGDSDEG